MTNENVLAKLPPDVAAAFRKAEAEDEYKAAAAVWTDMNQTAIDALLTVATIAWANAATPEEREMVVQHTAMTMTMIRQTKIVVETLAPPNPRRSMFEAVAIGLATEIASHDAWLRENFPGAAMHRGAVLRGEEPVQS